VVKKNTFKGVKKWGVFCTNTPLQNTPSKGVFKRCFLENYTPAYHPSRGVNYPPEQGGFQNTPYLGVYFLRYTLLLSKLT